MVAQVESEETALHKYAETIHCMLLHAELTQSGTGHFHQLLPREYPKRTEDASATR